MICRLIILLLIVGCVYADVLNVPYQYDTIKEASVDSDTVLIEQGIYYENLRLEKISLLTAMPSMII